MFLVFRYKAQLCTVVVGTGCTVKHEKEPKRGQDHFQYMEEEDADTSVYEQVYLYGEVTSADESWCLN